jgi:hypothetical protein
MKSRIPGNLMTTAMAVMPHTDPTRALDLALSLDIPFWPQLPNFSYFEDMYVQAAEHFPGIVWMWKIGSCGFPWRNSARNWKRRSRVSTIRRFST